MALVSCLIKQSDERPANGCKDQVEFQKKKKFLKKLSSKYVFVELSNEEKYPISQTETVSIKPTTDCPFITKYTDEDFNRVPRILPRVLCPRPQCSKDCKEVTITRTVLQKKCNSGFYKMFFLRKVTIGIGFIKEQK